MSFGSRVCGTLTVVGCVIATSADARALEPPAAVLDALEEAFPSGCYVAPKSRSRPERCASVDPAIAAAGDRMGPDEALMFIGDVGITVAWLDQKPFGEDLNPFFRGMYEKAGPGHNSAASGAAGWDRATFGSTKVYSSEVRLDSGPKFYVDLFHDGRRLIIISSVFAEGPVRGDVVARQESALTTVLGARVRSETVDPQTAPAYEKGRRIGEQLVLGVKIAFWPVLAAIGLFFDWRKKTAHSIQSADTAETMDRREKMHRAALVAFLVPLLGIAGATGLLFVVPAAAGGLLLLVIAVGAIELVRFRRLAAQVGAGGLGFHAAAGVVLALIMGGLALAGFLSAKLGPVLPPL